MNSGHLLCVVFALIAYWFLYYFSYQKQIKYHQSASELSWIFEKSVMIAISVCFVIGQCVLVMYAFFRSNGTMPASIVLNVIDMDILIPVNLLMPVVFMIIHGFCMVISCLRVTCRELLKIS